MTCNRVFDELQVAREALKRCCEDFSKEASGSKHSIFKSKGKSAKLIANEKMLEYADSDFDDVSALIYGLESEWKQKHSKVGRKAIQVPLGNILTQDCRIPAVPVLKNLRST